MKDMADKLRQMMQGKKNIVFFGGAGVSTESGLKDFRGEDGLDKMKSLYTPEEVLSRRFFYAHTDLFYQYYKAHLLGDARPNAAHAYLAKLEAQGILKGIITQNIDGLHQMAGSRNVAELHGSVMRNRCVKCRKHFDADYVRRAAAVPVCDACGGLIKPDVVLYGESLDPDVIDKAIRLIDEADLMIVGGTSLSVYPAAAFVSDYKGKMVIINKTPTPMDERADLLIQAPIGALFAQMMDVNA